MDEHIKLWDLRNIKSPIALYHGHAPGSGGRVTRIHRPTFLRNSASSSSEASTESFSDSFIVSGGEGSNALSMFQLNECDGSIGSSSLQSMFSRGTFSLGVGDVGSLAVDGTNVAVATEGGEVLLLSPGIEYNICVA
jgi:hypothetical protein